MVTPQQRGQVVVKSIGDINRETTVRARRTTRAAQNMAAIGSVAQNFGGIGSTVKGAVDTVAASRINHVIVGGLIIQSFMVPGTKVHDSWLFKLPALVWGGYSAYQGAMKSFFKK